MNEEAVSTPSTPMVEVDGYSFPVRIPGQTWIAEELPKMDAEEAEVFCGLLRDRRWTDAEFDERIYSVRPDLRPEGE